VPERIDHRKRFLGSGRVVEIDQRIPVDLLVKHRKLVPDLRKICFRLVHAAINMGGNTR
jgi:hypothetical protein